MIHYCPLAPLPYLKSVVPDFVFIEVAWWRSRQYRKYVTKQLMHRSIPVVIDNSTHLFGTPFGLPLQLAVVQDLRTLDDDIDITIVMPDVKNDSELTYALVKEALERYHNDLRELYPLRLMLVGQGQDVDHYYACATAMAEKVLKYDRIASSLTLGVPYQCVEVLATAPKYWASNRQSLLSAERRSQYGGTLVLYERIHLLGLSDPRELLGYRDLGREVFCDSSAPFAWAVEGFEFPVEGWNYERKPLYKLETIVDKDLNIVGRVFGTSRSDLVKRFLHNVSILDLYRTTTTSTGGALP